jgi:secondary thiamine-phosphate synthase enzyme
MATYLQRTFSLSPRKRGCHLITDDVLTHISSDVSQLSIGLLHLFIQHTSASLTLNENYDPTVRADMEDALNRLAPESASYRHDDEGADDMPAHIKHSLLGSSVSVPISEGKLALGTWQGVWLCEHRDRGGSRRLVATMHGQLRQSGGSTERKDRK